MKEQFLTGIETKPGDGGNVVLHFKFHSGDPDDVETFASVMFDLQYRTTARRTVEGLRNVVAMMEKQLVPSEAAAQPALQPKEELAIVERNMNQLAEHFDTVQIFTTRYLGGESTKDHGATSNIAMGTGNWFARTGQCHEWLLKEEESTRVDVRKREGEKE